LYRFGKEAYAAESTLAHAQPIKNQVIAQHQGKINDTQYLPITLAVLLGNVVIKKKNQEKANVKEATSFGARKSSAGHTEK
jgi:hypothetical protein